MWWAPSDKPNTNSICVSENLGETTVTKLAPGVPPEIFSEYVYFHVYFQILPKFEEKNRPCS